MSLWVATADPVEFRSMTTEDELQTVIRAVYRQVLGNYHVLESDRLYAAESLLRNGDITVKGFVRAVAQSDLYRALFFESSSPYRFIELNCKHLLGRAPLDQAEISEHVQRYNAEGYVVDINSYLDNDEYNTNFGDHTVPYYRTAQTQSGIKNVGFNRTFALVRGYSSSDVEKSARLTRDVAGNLPTKIIPLAKGSGSYSNTGKRFRISTRKATVGPRATRSNQTFEIGYAQLSKTIQNIQKRGGKILSITEVA
ncbi:MAG: phycobilisome rod-core linker polypeptide [Cyanobacteria bacterium J06626_14]